MSSLSRKVPTNIDKGKANFANPAEEFSVLKPHTKPEAVNNFSLTINH